MSLRLTRAIVVRETCRISAAIDKREATAGVDKKIVGRRVDVIEGITSDGVLQRCAVPFAQDSADTRLLDVPPGSFGRATEGDSGVRCISKGR